MSFEFFLYELIKNDYKSVRNSLLILIVLEVFRNLKLVAARKLSYHRFLSVFGIINMK